ncbi:MAG TPA: CsbD family protein [Bryocella sp.]|nr:CsbD family protein [Bryocella sp.]
MKSGMENKTKGKLDEVAGKIKQSTGEAINNQSMANRGAAQQVKGQGEQALGSVQNAAADTQARKSREAQAEAHDVRERVTSTARNVKERIEDSVDRHHDRTKY